MRHQRLQKFKTLSTPKDLQMQVKLEGAGTMGTKQPQCSQASGNPMTFPCKEQQQTSSPQNQPHNQPGPSIIGNHILKDKVGHRGNERQRFEWMSSSIFFFFISNCVLFPWRNFFKLVLFCFIVTTNIQDLVTSQERMEALK